MLRQSRLHTASETFVRQIVFFIRLDFLRFHIRCTHFDRKEYKNVGLSVQWPLVLVYSQKDMIVQWVYNRAGTKYR